MCLIEPTSQINAYDTKTYKKIDAPKGTTIYWGLLMLEGSEKAQPIAFYVDPQKEKLNYHTFSLDKMIQMERICLKQQLLIKQ